MPLPTDAPRLRLARLDEVERVRTIERRSATRFLGTDRAAIADDEPTDAATLTRRIDEQNLLVCEDDDAAPIAFVMFRGLEDCGYIEQIDVLPSHARRRLGAALLTAVAQLGQARGWSALLLSTFKDVPWNAPYYRRLGFIDLDDATLTPALRQIRRAHEARGLDETARVFMRLALATAPRR